MTPVTIPTAMSTRKHMTDATAMVSNLMSASPAPSCACLTASTVGAHCTVVTPTVSMTPA
eukprot:CAMPEP_0185203544 /NCGR_PEP_ID=MMETSP1140-20130426/53223_1 /TAXON_ID=298111 /ORGANISM="Pavlova sp., Strain CCMP459" /LENGTH=59 /DNA_ID=CAMNT_0027771049 /DNA_START=32 /DNA_END=207 /DNA_ORIENTATION=-